MQDYLLEIHTSGGGGNKNKINYYQRTRYIRFTTKQRPKQSTVFKSLLKFVASLISIITIWGMLIKVNPLNPIIRYLVKNDSSTSIMLLENNLVEILRVFNHKGEELIFDFTILVYMLTSIMIINELYWRLNHRVEESLLIIAKFGVQTESVIIKRTLWGLVWTLFNNIFIDGCTSGGGGSSGAGNSGSSSSSNMGNKWYNVKEEKIILNRQFIPMEYVKDIIINEGFVNSTVLFYMGLIIKEPNGKMKMTVVFPMLRPRRAILERVYRGSRCYLDEEFGNNRIMRDDDSAELL